MQTRRAQVMEAFDRKGGWSTILFSAVLFGHPADPARSHGYMVKALQNLEIIHARCPGARTVLYYDGTVSGDLLAQIRALELSVTLVWVEHRVGRGIMLARLLELTARRPGVRWVALLDIHDEFDTQHSYLRGLDEAIRRVVVPDEREYDLQVMIFAPHGRCREFVGRTPHRHADCGGVAASPQAGMPPMAGFIAEFFAAYDYAYGDDEHVLDRWLSTRAPRWYELRSPGILYLPGDEERDMDLSGARVLGVGAGADRAAADEVLDWTAFCTVGRTRRHCGHGMHDPQNFLAALA